nr:MAG TPA: hypothetical protein [Microviridae sp.]
MCWPRRHPKGAPDAFMASRPIRKEANLYEKSKNS